MVESLYREAQGALLQFEAPTPIVINGKLHPKWGVHPAFIEVIRECKRCNAEAVQLRTDGRTVKAICLHCFNIQEA